ncbi:hypothetical protein L1887_05972 [Cichorium endivia]|nr:hypothetical protein L1887_05972 [Cichorium endivia]
MKVRLIRFEGGEDLTCFDILDVKLLGNQVIGLCIELNQMGLSFSWPYANINDLDDHIESIISKSLSFKENDIRTLLRSFSFDDTRSSKPVKMRSFRSNSMIRGSQHRLSFE